MGFKVSDLQTEETEAKIQELVAKMTLKEKAGQMLNIGLPLILKGEYWDVRDSVNFDAKKFKKSTFLLGLLSTHLYNCRA